MESDASPMQSLASREDVSNILLLGSRFDAAESDYCSSLLQCAPPHELAAIAVSFSPCPDQLVSKFSEQLGEFPQSFHLVNAGGHTRNSDPEQLFGGDLPAFVERTGCSVRTVGYQGNLTELGVRITECLEEIDDLDGVRATSLCFRSLTPVLVHTDASTVLKFLQVLRGQLATHDVVGHFHLDPAAQDEEVIGLLSTAFDGIVDFTGDEVTITTR